MGTSLKKKQKNWVGSMDEEEKIPVVSGSGSTGFESTFQAKRKPQYLAAFAATLGSFSLGLVLGFSAPALVDLEKSQDLGALSGEAKSWIASLAVLGALISGPLAGLLINTKLGRKYTAILLALIFFIPGWILIAFAQNLIMMYIGRFLTGFAGGAYTVIVPVYISETAEDKLRGFLGSTMVLMLVTGILFTFTAAAVVSWFWLSVISAVFPLIFIIAMCFMPETPRFLLLKGKTAQAYESLRWLRGATNMDQIETEMTKLRDSLENNNIGGTSILALKKPSVLKPTGISLALMFFQQLGGINAICFYTVQILKAANPNFDANIASIIIGVVQVVFVAASMILVDRIGRKLLLFVSDVIMALSLTALGVFFYLKNETETNTHSTSMAFVPLISLISFIIAYSAGAGPLPWLLMSEILPPHAKGLASGIVTSLYWFLAFLATKTFDNLIELLGEHGCYWLYASICTAGAVFTLIFVPETKGKTYEEISRRFKD